MTDASIAGPEESGEAQFVVFQIGSEEFGIDISHVREIIKVPSITKMPSAPSFIEGVLNLRGMITTVMDLRKRLDIDGTDSAMARIIIVEIGDTAIGLVVDSVTEVLRLSSMDVEPVPTFSTGVTTECIKGVGKIGGEDDRLLILLDVRKILSKEEFSRLEEVAKASA
jgi:purine-binding chemotaxis protein CheW